MPRRVRRTRYPPTVPMTARQLAQRRQYVRKYKKIVGTPKGSLAIVRKPSLIRTYSEPGVAGIIHLNDPTGTCLQLGTPVFITGTSNCYDVPFSMTFRLDQLMNSNEIQVLFDRYKIISALVKVHYNVNNSDATKTFPWIEYIQDHDDAAIPSVAVMREKQGVKSKFFGTNKFIVKMGVRPRFADSVYNNGVTTAYGIGNRREYLNMSYPGVEHYGIKGVLHNVPLSGLGTGGNLFDFDVSLKVVCKDIQ